MNTKLNRRQTIGTFAAASVAAFTAGTAARADDISAELLNLIEAHRKAEADYDAALDAYEAAEVAFRDEYAEAPITMFHMHGGKHLEIRPNEQSHYMRERMQQHVAEHFDWMRRKARGCVPEAALADVVAEINRDQRAVYRRLVKAVQWQADRHADRAYAKADFAKDAACTVEMDATRALLGYRCRNMAELAVKFAYVNSRPLIVDGIGNCDGYLDALLESFEGPAV